MHIGYASQTVHLPPGSYPCDLVIEGRAPGRRYGFAAFAGEHDRWTVSVMSYGHGVRPPTDPGGAPASRGPARSGLVGRGAAQRAGGRTRSRRTPHPASVWAELLECLDGPPAGLIAFGDAIAAFNPIYGTGMTVAVEQALALQTALRDGVDEDLPGRFYRGAVRPLSQAWQLSTGADLAYPETEGRRTRVGSFMGRYVARGWAWPNTTPRWPVASSAWSASWTRRVPCSPQGRWYGCCGRRRAPRSTSRSCRSRLQRSRRCHRMVWA